MTSRPPVVVNEDGKLVSRSNKSQLPYIETPDSVGYGGVAFGWLETWRMRQHNQAVTAYAGYLKTLVSIAGYEAELKVITDWKNVQNKISLAGETIAFDLAELQRKAKKNKELEDIESDQRAIERELVKARKSAQATELTNNARPVEDRVRDVILHFSKIISDARIDNSLSVEDRSSLCDQFEALRDAQLFQLTGKSIRVPQAQEKEPKGKKSQAEKDQECELLAARFAVDCAMLRCDASNDARQIERSIKALRIDMELKCQAIRNS